MTTGCARRLCRFGGAVWLAASAAWGLGCDNATAGSCDWRPHGGDRCFEYSTDAVAVGKDGCTGGHVWRDTPCDLAGSIGGCKMSGGTTKWLFPSDAIKTRADASTECTEWLEPRR